MLNVMVVDDSLIIRKTLSNELEKMGHKVVAQAKSGKEAVALYKENMPDLVTMDITMPIMSGIEALKKIKKNYPNACIIMVTSHGEEKLVMDAISSGARGYILKPISQEKIQNVIEKLFPDTDAVVL
ncbi:MAG: response regulator [Campylobacterota bacterium]|nr:response regulator [Campylobacterota bacterium]